MRFEDVPDLNAKQLLAIVTIAEYGSFTTAASVLDMSQPALSRILSAWNRSRVSNFRA
jgi:DNA-binding transcriptional LysR family regulator